MVRFERLQRGRLGHHELAPQMDRSLRRPIGLRKVEGHGRRPAAARRKRQARHGERDELPPALRGAQG